MPIYYGSNKIGKIFYGTNQVYDAYNGTNRVFAGDKTIDLGSVTINATGDYANNYYCNAHAYKVRQNGTWYLKVTGKWYSKGNNASGNVTPFATNINVGSQKAQVTVTCQCFYNTTSDNPSSFYTTYDGYVTTGGVLYLPLGHENVYRTFNQYDYQNVMVQLNPS